NVQLRAVDGRRDRREMQRVSRRRDPVHELIPSTSDRPIETGTMNMSDPTHPEKEAPAPPDAAGSDEPVAPNAFAKALEDFERGKPPAEAQQRRIAAGMKLRGTLVSISDDQSLLDIGGRSEGVIETRHLRDEAGTVTHRPGDVIELYVVSEDPLTLAPALKADPGAALRQLRESRASGIPVTGRVTGR